MTEAAPSTKPETSLTVGKPAWVQQFVARARGEMQSTSSAALSRPSYLREGGSAILEYTEGGVTGSLLGAAHAKWGLDSAAGPVDGWIAGLGAALGLALSGHFPGAAAHIRRVAAQAFTVLAFRKGYEVVKHEPLPGGTAPGVRHIAAPGKGAGVSRVDPIEEAAKGLEGM